MRKIIVGIDLGNYAFDPPNSQITLFNVPNISLVNLVLIVDVSTGVMLYNFADPTMSGTIINNVITLEVNCSAMNPLDDLQIILDLPDIISSIPDSLVTQDDSFVEYSEQMPVTVAPFFRGQQDIQMALPVALANQQVFDLQGPITTVLSPAVGYNLAQQDCLQYRSVAVQIDTGAGISAGVVTFEGSNGLDASNNWAAITLIDLAAATPVGATSLTLAASVNRYFTGSTNFRYFRVRVSTAVAGGVVSCVCVYRMTPFSQPLITGYAGINVAQLGGTTQVTGGLAGTQAVGGASASGVVLTYNALLVGGVDYAGLMRRVITDNQGHIAEVGPDPSRIAGTNPIKTREVDNDLARQTPSELLEQILWELKLNNYYLKEMPWMLNMPFGYFKEDISDFSGKEDYKLGGT